ncbi:hypothetical protein GCM10010381_61750 [Streptomyces xantholiticus]|nr:hypothetical protein GCM10010381_61750 [Streptomyces xantholiticus]
MRSEQGTHTPSTKAMGMSPLHHAVRQDPFAELSRFRDEFHSCLTRRADALFELADAVLCADGPVRSLVELSLVGEAPSWAWWTLRRPGCGPAGRGPAAADPGDDAATVTARQMRELSSA